MEEQTNEQNITQAVHKKFTKNFLVLACVMGGGLEEDRTLDLCVANAALSRLSYEPVLCLLFNLDHSIHSKIEWSKRGYLNNI